MLALCARAWAAPGDLPDRPDKEDGAVTVIDAAAAKGCSLKSGLCVTAGGRSTIAVESAPVVAVSAAAKTAAVPRFARAQSGAAGEWTLEVSGTLKRPAWPGNALFLLFDLDDPEAVENRQYTALYQATLKAGNKLGARLTLNPDEGFRAGHTYRLRIVQLINGKEILLAEADASLL
jgi:hypothetical protein